MSDTLLRCTANNPRDAERAKMLEDYLNQPEIRDEIMYSVALSVIAGSHWFTPYEPDYQRQCQLWQDDGGR
jgi:hypothetical protein